MPSAKVKLLDFSGGLYLQGAAESIPANGLRRATGMHSGRRLSLRSRDGSRLIASYASHSVYRFGNSYYMGVGSSLYKGTTLMSSVFNGSRLTFARMPPTYGKDDWLFIGGGGRLMKTNGTNTYDWGIDPPPDGFTATKVVRQTKLIENFDSKASWTQFPPEPTAGMELYDDTTNFQDQDASVTSLKVAISQRDRVRIWKTFASMDLDTYVSGDASPPEDFITFWIMLDNPTAIQQISLSFLRGTGTFDSNGDSANLYVANLSLGAASSYIQGVSNFLPEDLIAEENRRREENELDASLNSSPTTDQIDQATTQQSTPVLPKEDGTWLLVRLTKKDFAKRGSGTADWSDIQGIRFSLDLDVDVADLASVWLDGMYLAGSVGMQGKYKHCLTFKSSVTGHRSNANKPVTTGTIDRDSIQLANLPTTCSDPQVDKLEVWRTFGDGVLFFLADTLDLGTATYEDKVADYVGMHRSSSKYLASTQLDFDNNPPDDTYTQILGPVFGRMWWTGNTAATKRGRLAYSPVSRPEAMSASLEVSEDDDPTQTAVEFGGRIYVFTEGAIIRIDNTTEPFIPRRVPGAPGTLKPYTVRSTPFGIIYEAADGLRLFDGSNSALLGAGAINDTFRGITVDGVPPFEGEIAAYGNEWYYISDGSETYAYCPERGVWRAFGLGMTALGYAPDTQCVIASWGSKTYEFEKEGQVTDGGSAIPINWKTPSLLDDPTELDVVQRVVFDIDTANQLLDVSSIIDGVKTTHKILTTQRDRREIPIGRKGRIIQFQVEANVLLPIELFGIIPTLYTTDDSLKTALKGLKTLVGEPAK